MGTLNGRLSALHHVGQQRQMRSKKATSLTHLSWVFERLDEECIHAALEVGLGSLQSRGEALDRNGVGPGQNERVCAASGIQGGHQLAAHVGCAHQAFAAQVSAAFGKRLVLELDHGCTRPLKLPHRALGVERVAKSSVRIHNDGQTHALTHQPNRLRDFAGRHQTHITSTQTGVSNRSPRQIQSLKTRLLGHQSAQCVINTGGQQDLGAPESVLECDGSHERSNPKKTKKALTNSQHNSGPTR